MKLSELNSTPTYPITIPSTGKKTTFRPFLVREEKALLTAQESEDITTMIATMESVARKCVANCPERLTPFDLEYIMTMIRAKSVGEYSELMFSCDVCTDPEAVAKVKIDLTKVQVSKSEHKGKIKLSETLTASMRYPSIQDIITVSESSDKDLTLIKKCLDKLHTAEETYDLSEESDEEIEEFISTLTSKQKKEISYFVDSIPYTYIQVQYECPVCGKKHDRELKGINNFF